MSVARSSEPHLAGAPAHELGVLLEQRAALRAQLGERAWCRRSAGSSKPTTVCRQGSLSRTSATFAACVAFETNTSFASESPRMYCTAGAVSVG